MSDTIKALRMAAEKLACACVDAPEIEPHEAYEAVCAALAAQEQTGLRHVGWSMRNPDCDGSADWAELGTVQPAPATGFVASRLYELAAQEQADHFPDAGNMVAQPVAEYHLSTDEQGALKRAMFGSAKVLSTQPVAVPDVGQMEYEGNSVAFIFQKMRAYRSAIDNVWAVLASHGYQADGTTRIDDMVLRAILAAPAAPKREPLIPIPADVVEQAVDALGRFCSDEGWGSDDMQAMDNLDAYLAQHKARITKEPQ